MIDSLHKLTPRGPFKYTLYLLLPLSLLGCDLQESSTSSAEQSSVQAETSSENSKIDDTAQQRSPFKDVTTASGLSFNHQNGGNGRMYMPEIMGAGGALLDIDGDQDLDIYLVQGGPIDADGMPASDQLWRNDSTRDENGVTQLRFTNVTEASGIKPGGYGMGATTGDINSDGWTDLYISNFGANRLLLNLGNGQFKDVTQAAGATDEQWSVPATFLDFDGDGDMDLYSGSYVDFRLANHRDCFSGTGLPDYCSPHSYNALADRLFRNDGDGNFENVSALAGLRKVPSKALGVITGDFDDDGFIDLYVANDGVANQLWLNQQDGSYEETALFAGCALNSEGLPEASMGVDAADVDGDGDEDLFMTHLRGETNTLYINNGNGSFEDRTIRLGLAGPSIPYTGFGTSWLDVENDGKLDLLAANGAVTVEERLVAENDPYPYHQPNQLFKNVSDGDSVQFQPYPQDNESPFTASHVSRGALFGDLDNDGDTDVIIANNNGPAQVLQNTVGQDNGWLGLAVSLNEQGSPALGAAVQITTSDGRTLMRRVRSAGSYVSGNDPRILFGLADAPRDEEIEVRVRWVGSKAEEIEVFGPLQINQYHTLVRGRGKPFSTPAGKAQ